MALALPHWGGRGQGSFGAGRVFYNFGHIGTYAVMGTALGLLGQGGGVRYYNADFRCCAAWPWAFPT